MTLLTLVLYIGIAAVLLTLITGFVLKILKSWFISFLQNYAGALFIFSGWVKAVDPLGTAYKMEDYFAEFYATFHNTMMGFIAPLFPFLSNYSTAFAIFMILFEIILGIMLIMGIRPKFTSWAFLLLVLFFTVLTGFTFLTGYVPQGVNFFEFGKWTAYKASNMRVTDCGCFGDFIKLEPRISFYKDLVLLIPSVIFVLNWRKFHKILTVRQHNIILLVSTVILLFYSIYNFYWNEPHMDFRPFKIGTDVASVQKKERDAMAAVQVTAFRLKNKTTGEIKDIPYAEYLKTFEQYAEDWETIEQLKTEPSVPQTKISEFMVTDFDNNDKTATYLSNPEYNIMIYSGKPLYRTIEADVEQQDTVFRVDTIFTDARKDSFQLSKTVDKIVTNKVRKQVAVWDQNFVDVIKNRIKPFTDKAAGKNVSTTFLMSGIDASKAEILKKETGLDVEFFTADEKLIKTIGRSNPGIILWKDGKILEKWHYKKLPPFDKVAAKYLK
jgi:uncharacterized membrane protein YphA (DoxX/SURF4 family)